jgi:hypothetical protein
MGGKGFVFQNDNGIALSFAVSENVPVRLLGNRFEARNCFGEPGPQEPYVDIF